MVVTLNSGDIKCWWHGMLVTLNVGALNFGNIKCW